MRTGSPSWNITLGVFNLDFDWLKQISYPSEKAVSDLAEDIKKNGLLHPLEAHLLLEENYFTQLRLFKGNQRLCALKKLGWKKAPCKVIVEGYRDNEHIGKALEAMITQSYHSSPTTTEASSTVSYAL